MKEYDVAIIGGGPGGDAAAGRAIARGLKTCLIEAVSLGGACLNVGCIPTKAMLYASDLFHHMRQAGQFGLNCPDPRVDGRAYMKRVHGVVAGLVKALDKKYQSPGVDLLRGTGRLAGPGTITVDLNAGGREEIRASSVIIATGSSPVRPGVFPWDIPTVMTTDQAVTADALPASVLIVGGGVIGCEFATVYSELGIPTTIVEMLDRLAAPLDEDASKLIHRSLRMRGAEVLLRSRIVQMSAGPDGVTARTEDGKTLQAACALVAVGRRPNVVGLGLEQAGVELTDGIIAVDDHCRTNVPGIYAVGDVAEKRQYAHLASRMGVVAAENAAGRDVADDRTCVPVGVFTHPEVATVGLGEAEARREHSDIRVASAQYRATGIALAYGRTDGMVKIIAEAGSGRAIGGLVVGYHAADVVQELAAAMRNSLTVTQLAATIHVHPTFSEGVLLAAENWLAGQ